MDIVANSNRFENNEDATENNNSGNDKPLNFVSALTEGSSVHAVSQVGQATTKGRKTFWLAVLLSCLCICIYQVNNFLSLYFQYPVLIDVAVKNSRSLEFPAVTICNINRMKNFHSDCVKKELKWIDCNGMAGLYRTLVFSERKKYTSTKNETNVQEKDYKIKSQEFFNHYSNIDAPSKKCYGHRLHELITRCSFDSMVCNHEDFTYFHSIQYGNCFTFNRKLKPDQQPLYVRKTGPNSGLELDINLSPTSYLSTTTSTGSRVVIHSPLEDPNPGDDGINISPGYETQVNMVKTSIHRLPPPYRDRCSEYKDNDTAMGSQFDCIRNCMQQTSMSLCGCIDPFLKVDQGMIPCNLKNISQMVCLDGILESMSENGLPCECPLPCISTTYNLRSSLSNVFDLRDSDDFGWTQDPICEHYFFRSKRGSSVEDANRHLNSYRTEAESVRRNQRVRRATSETKAKLKVFYGSLEHTIYSQKAMFSESELSGQLGGNLSLWLGLSLVAMFEYVEKLFLLLHFIVKKKSSTI